MLLSERKVRWMGHVAYIREKRIAYMGEPEIMRSLGRPRHRWENIKMHHREM
jgi:hypothetical protein